MFNRDHAQLETDFLKHFFIVENVKLQFVGHEGLAIEIRMQIFSRGQVNQIVKKTHMCRFYMILFYFSLCSLCSFCYMLPRHLQVPAVFVWVNITPRLCGVFVVLGVCLETHGGRLHHDGAVLGSGRGCNRSRLKSWKSHPKFSSNRYN